MASSEEIHSQSLSLPRCARGSPKAKRASSSSLNDLPLCGKTSGRELHHDKGRVTRKGFRTALDHVDLISVHVHFHKINPGRLLFGDPIVQTENLSAFERIKILKVRTTSEINAANAIGLAFNGHSKATCMEKALLTRNAGDVRYGATKARSFDHEGQESLDGVQRLPS